jgi:hypothetical protein
MLTLDRPAAHDAMIRELARNVERVLTGAEDVCLANRGHQPSCVCHRDAHHAGPHRCLCGIEWPAP